MKPFAWVELRLTGRPIAHALEMGAQKPLKLHNARISKCTCAGPMAKQDNLAEQSSK